MKRNTFCLTRFLRRGLILSEIPSAVNAYIPKFLHDVPKLENRRFPQSKQ